MPQEGEDLAAGAGEQPGNGVAIRISADTRLIGVLLRSRRLVPSTMRFTSV
ncbi:hypothetical protein SAMN05444920_13327 [Nonomuraea solani]|uniref:Uncharacterized protein n=1 Tax=Nonomuraea solani TaxID=1144553 RepID=A0A1H6F0K4_9ACTN|nr:hypothetical protein [Nonomuraea solani]SEH03123.1 hypothetical protein SAMN05444920_13327 [Nonomuraea solani]